MSGEYYEYRARALFVRDERGEPHELTTAWTPFRHDAITAAEDIADVADTVEVQTRRRGGYADLDAVPEEVDR